MDVAQVGLLVGIGIVGGVWNAIAGGATLFTFPALMAVGLPPLVANATNFLALLPANVAALPAYRAELRRVEGGLLPLLVVSGGGALVGANLLLVSDPEVFFALIPLLILIATGLFAFGDAVRAGLLARLGERRSLAVIFAILFVASIYGGFFGAGLSIVLLAVAQIMGFDDFQVANAIKNLLAASFTLLSILVFGAGGLIAWPEAAVMMAGSTAGGYLGGRVARHVDQKALRTLVICFGLLLTAVYVVRVVG